MGFGLEGLGLERALLTYQGVFQLSLRLRDPQHQRGSGFGCLENGSGLGGRGLSHGLRFRPGFRTR